MYGIRVVLCFKQKSRMWMVAVTILPSKVEMVAGVKPNCWLIGKHCQNSSTISIMDSVVQTSIALHNQKSVNFRAKSDFIIMLVSLRTKDFQSALSGLNLSNKYGKYKDDTWVCIYTPTILFFVFTRYRRLLNLT